MGENDYCHCGCADVGGGDGGDEEESEKMAESAYLYQILRHEMMQLRQSQLLLGF